MKNDPPRLRALQGGKKRDVDGSQVALVICMATAFGFVLGLLVGGIVF